MSETMCPRYKRVPTSREFQIDVAFCFGSGMRCTDLFESIDGRRDYRCSNCHLGHRLKNEKDERKEKERQEA